MSTMLGIMDISSKFSHQHLFRTAFSNNQLVFCLKWSLSTLPILADDLSSEVFADDIFHTNFKPNPMNREQGLKYRYGVLEKGGTQDEMKTLRKYLGREPDARAFYSTLGIA